MSEEYLDIVDENGNLTGEKELRSVVHEKGLWHQVAVIYFFRFKNQNSIDLIVHLRSITKKEFPNRWITRFGGHIITGSTPKDTAIKEVAEEAGIAVDSKKLLTGIKSIYDSEYDKEIINAHYYEFDGDINKLSFNDGEVQEAKWMNESDIIRSLHDNPDLWTNSERALLDVIKDIKSRQQ